MKIIERGKHPQETIYRLRCRSCATLFEFERHEARFHPDFRDGDYLGIHCPVCGAYETLSVPTSQYHRP